MTLKQVVVKYNISYQAAKTRLERCGLGCTEEFILTPERHKILSKPTRAYNRTKPLKVKVIKAAAWQTAREKNNRVSTTSKKKINEVFETDRWYSEDGMPWAEIGSNIGKSSTATISIFKSAMGKIMDALQDVHESPETKTRVFLEVLRETFKA